MSGVTVASLSAAAAKVLARQMLAESNNVDRAEFIVITPLVIVECRRAKPSFLLAALSGQTPRF